jgi:hypothetical protein
MSKLKRALGAASGAVGAAQAAYEVAVTVEGQPVRARTEPASIRIFGIPVFERDGELERTWFGVIKRGKSKVAKAALEKEAIAAAARGERT